MQTPSADEMKELTGICSDMACTLEAFIEKRSDIPLQDAEKIDARRMRYAELSKGAEPEMVELKVNEPQGMKLILRAMAVFSEDMKQLSTTPFLLMLADAGLDMAAAVIRGDHARIEDLLIAYGFKAPRQDQSICDAAGSKMQ